MLVETLIKRKYAIDIAKMEFVISESPGWHKIEAVDNNTKVSWLSIPDIEVHYGASKIIVGGIAGVYTPREFRGKGYSASTLNYAIEWMRNRGYALSELFGIQEYYHRFGFATFMGEHTVTISLRDASRIEAREYEWEISDDPSFCANDIANIYEETNANWITSRVRKPNEWNGFRKGVSWEHTPKVLVIRSGKQVFGYAAIERWANPDELLVAEVGAKSNDKEVYRALLKNLFKLALEEKKSRIRIHVPPDHEIVNVLRPYGISIESTFLWSGGGMARVINLTKLLKDIEVELAERSKGVTGEASLEIPGESATIKVNDGEVRITQGSSSINKVKMDPGETAQLILGYREPEELLSKVEAYGEPGVLVRLFPLKTPYVWQPDRW
jgi:predicted acetyltransferase